MVEVISTSSPAVECAFVQGRRTINFQARVDCGATHTAMSEAVYMKQRPKDRNLHQETWTVSQADKSELVMLGSDRAKIHFQGYGELEIKFVVIRGLAADLLLGNDFIDGNDVCFTSKHPLTGEKTIIFGKTGWEFPFLRDGQDREPALASLILGEAVAESLGGRVSREAEVRGRLEDDAILIESTDPDIEEMVDSISEETDDAQNYFLVRAPLPKHGKGR
jgi:hypothetical protein